jgi:hypothetical protein
VKVEWKRGWGDLLNFINPQLSSNGSESKTVDSEASGPPSKVEDPVVCLASGLFSRS